MLGRSEDTMTIITHLIAFLFGIAGGGYAGYRWGAGIAKDVAAVKNVTGQGGAAPPK